LKWKSKSNISDMAIEFKAISQNQARKRKFTFVYSFEAIEKIKRWYYL